MFGNSAAVPPKRKEGPYVTRQKQTLAGLRRSAAAEQTRFERLVKRAAQGPDRWLGSVSGQNLAPGGGQQAPISPALSSATRGSWLAF